MPGEIGVVLLITGWVIILLVVAAVLERSRGSRQSWEDVEAAVAAGCCVTEDAVLPEFLSRTDVPFPCGDGSHRHSTEVEAAACVLLRSVWEEQAA